MEMDVDKKGTGPPLRGIVNDIAVFERRGPGFKSASSKSDLGPGSLNSETRGLCIVAALGKEHRLGRWKVFNANDNKNNGRSAVGGRNGAVVFEVPFSADLIITPTAGTNLNGISLHD
jgi:ribosomal RNA-processing protein 9